GRQTDETEKPYEQRAQSGCIRLVIARLNEDSVSRRHALLEPLPNGRLKVQNVSAKLPIGLPEGGRLRMRESCELAMPTLLTFGPKTIRIQCVPSPLPLSPHEGRGVPDSPLSPAEGERGRGEGASEELQGLAEVTQAPGQLVSPSFKLPSLALPSASEM